MEDEGFVLRRIASEKRAPKGAPEMITIKAYMLDNKRKCQARCFWNTCTRYIDASSLDDISATDVIEDLKKSGYAQWRDWMISKEFLRNAKGIHIDLDIIHSTTSLTDIENMLGGGGVPKDNPSVLITIRYKGLRASFCSPDLEDVKISLNQIKLLGNDRLSIESDQIAMSLSI
jgi:hypothetical protein